MADALTKGSVGPLEVLREFIHRAKWKLVYDPSFTSSRKLKAAGRLGDVGEILPEESDPSIGQRVEEGSPATRSEL